MARLRRDPLLQDVLGALVLVVACAVLREADPARELWPWGWVIVVVAAAGLAVRRRFPLPALVVTGVATLLYYPLGFPGNPLGLAFALTLYSVAQHRRKTWIVAVVAFAGGLTLVASLLAEEPEAPIDLAALTALLLVTAALGETSRARQLRYEAAEERARVAADTERLRIARELHDSLAHQISLIAVQSGAALHSGNPERAQEALRAVNTASKEALGDLRAALGVMRDVDTWRTSVAPDPGLADLSRLVEGVRATGLDVRFTTETFRAVPAVEFAVYRIVQEALTNVVRHADAQHVDVTVSAVDGTVHLRISDDGYGTRGTRGTQPGNGLRGLRERAVAVGGRLEVHDAPTGLTVEARLPLGGEE